MRRWAEPEPPCRCRRRPRCAARTADGAAPAAFGRPKLTALLLAAGADHGAVSGNAMANQPLHRRIIADAATWMSSRR